MNTTIESTSAAKQLIFALLDDVDGELSSRSRVVDGLLDLRNAAPADSELLTRIDELLLSVPGVTTVPNRWWLDRLEELRDLT